MAVNPQHVRVAPPVGSRFRSWTDFYPFYLGEHANRTCRRLHVLGTSGVVALAAAAAASGLPRLLLGLPLLGYGAAWAGHFFFEHNRPATFKYPLWSLLSDFVMWAEVLTGRRPF